MTSVYVGISTPTGATLGDEYVADTNTFSPILASTFETLFDETIQRRHKAFDGLTDHIELEDDTFNLVSLIFEPEGATSSESGEKIVLEDGSTDNEYDLRLIRKLEVLVVANPTRTSDNTNGISFIGNVTQESILGDTLGWNLIYFLK